MLIEQLLNRIDEKKRQLDSYRPLPPELVRNLDEWFAVDYTYNSNAIEGNTLSLSETAIVVEKGITIGGKTIHEHLEAIDHMKAIDFIKTLARKNSTDITTDDILAIDKTLLQRIVDLNVGTFRKVDNALRDQQQFFLIQQKIPI